VGFFSRDRKIVSELIYQHTETCTSNPKNLVPGGTKQQKKDIEARTVERCAGCPHAECGACSEVAGDLIVSPRGEE
jgi:hypothetical protein